jgi:hypothetical protein
MSGDKDISRGTDFDGAHRSMGKEIGNWAIVRYLLEKRRIAFG